MVSAVKAPFMPNARMITFAMGILFFTVYGGRIALTSLINLLAEETAMSKTWKATLVSSFYWGYAPPQIVSGWIASHGSSNFTVLLLLLCTALSFLVVSCIIFLHSSTAAEGLDDSRLLAIAIIIGICGFGQSVFVPVYCIICSQLRAIDSNFVDVLRANMSWCARVSRFIFTAATPLVAARIGVSPTFALVGILTLTTTACFYAGMPVGKPTNDTEEEGGAKEAVVALCGRRFWRLVCSGSAISIMLGHFAGNWLEAVIDFVCLSTLVQRYDLDLVEAASYHSLPKLLGFVTPYVTLFFDQQILRKQWRMDTLRVRRTCSWMGGLGGMLSMVWMFFSPSAGHFFAAMLLYNFTKGFQSSGYSANYSEVGGLANSGVLGSVGNTIANCAGAFAPMIKLLCGSVFGHEDYIFLLSAGICFVSALHYAVYSSIDQALVPRRVENKKVQ